MVHESSEIAHRNPSTLWQRDDEMSREHSTMGVEKIKYFRAQIFKNHCRQNFKIKSRLTEKEPLARVAWINLKSLS